MKRKIMFMALAVLMLLGIFAGCAAPQQATVSTPAASSSTVESQAAASGEKIKLALVVITLSNPVYVEMKAAAEEQAKEMGATVDVFAADNESDFQAQLAKFENAVNNPDYKGIAVCPMSAENLVVPIAEASKKGKLILNVDDKIDAEALEAAGGKLVGFVSTDNEVIGQKGAKLLADKIGGTGKVAIIEGQSGSWCGEGRKKGAADYFASISGIKVVASQPADWDRQKALDVATNILQANPDLKGFYAANDAMALGIYQAIKNVGKEKDCFVVGTDGIAEAYASIDAGEIYGTVAQDFTKMGKVAIKTLVDAINSKFVPTTAKVEQTAIDSIVVTKDNVGDFLK